jgi:hypothetical protein
MKEKLSAAAIGQQPLDEKERELLTEIYNRLEVFEQGCRPYHEAAREAREILRMRDPRQDDGENAGKPTLQLQTLKSTFNNVVAEQMQNMPEARILPETPEQSSMAEDLQDAVRFIVYDVNNYETIHRRIAEDIYGPGTAVVQTVWDPSMNYGKGDIAIIRWPIEAFLWDTKAEYLQDSRACIKVSWHPLSWYEAHYPDKAPYVNAEDGQHNEVGMPESQKDMLGEDEGRAMLLEYWYREYNAKSHRYTINVAYCAGGALLENHKDVYWHGMYPFDLDVHSTVEGSMVGEGMVTELAPMMRYINRYARYIDTNLRMSSKGRILTRRGSGIDREALADWSKDMVEGDSIENGSDWAWMQHAPLNGMIVQQMLQYQNDMKQDSGANQFTRGETMNGITSGKAIASLQAAGGKITSLRTATLNNGFREMVKKIIWLMSEYYDDDRMLLITGRDGQSRQINVHSLFGHRGKGAVEPPPYMVQIEINQKNPVRIEAMNEMYMQAYTMAAQAQQFFPLSSLFEMLNIDGKDRLLPVIRQNEQWQQQMQQMQQQNVQMQQEIESLQQERDGLRTATTQMSNALAGMSAGQQGATPATPATPSTPATPAAVVTI